jgi:hypothetical protein
MFKTWQFREKNDVVLKINFENGDFKKVSLGLRTKCDVYRIRRAEGKFGNL